MKRLLYILLLLPLLSHGQLNLDNNKIQLDSGRIVTTQGTIDSYDFRVLYTQTKQRVITNTVTETTFFNDTNCIGTRTVPANFMRVGRVINIYIRADFSCNGNPTNVIKVYFGDTLLVTSSKTLAVNPTNEQAEVKVDIVCTAVGASGKITVMGSTYLTGGQGRALINRSATINTTIPNTLNITYTWGTASASNTLINAFGMIRYSY